jgi:hypothetical protein
MLMMSLPGQRCQKNPDSCIVAGYSSQTADKSRSGIAPRHDVLERKKPPLLAASIEPVSHMECVYLSWVEMLLNFVFKVEPIELTVAMITTEIPAAIKPYSMAVAPDSFLRNARTRDMLTNSLSLCVRDRSVASIKGPLLCDQKSLDRPSGFS